MISAEQLVKQYELQRHPEGGWYKETYRSNEYIPANALPARFGGGRAFSTAIYFLLEQNDFSAFHRIKSDECWHFYAGDPLLVSMIQPNGELDIIQLGSDSAKGQLFQYIVPANCWFASRPASNSTFCFVGCTVSPGFDFTDFELGDANSLATSYPKHEKLIRELCR